MKSFLKTVGTVAAMVVMTTLVVVLVTVAGLPSLVCGVAIVAGNVAVLVAAGVE